jgi:hypothetical protein
MNPVFGAYLGIFIMVAAMVYFAYLGFHPEKIPFIDKLEG